MNTTNLGSAAIKGLKWTTLASVTNILLQVGYTSIMARLLELEDFGIVTMSLFIMRFGGYFAQMGMGQALIQKKDINTHDIRVAFTSTFFLGLFFSCLFYFLAPFSSLFFNDPKITPKIVSAVEVMSLSFFLSGLSSTSMNLLRKKMDFRLLSIVEICSYILGYFSVGVILAYNGFGYWSIIIAGLSQIVFSTIISYSLVQHNIVFLFKWKYYKPLLSFGGKISFISLLEFLRVHLSTLVLGRLFSASILAIYSRAFELISLPIYYLTTNFSKVLLPTFSILQDDKPKLKNAVLSSLTMVGYIVVPICFGISMAAEQLILTLLGVKFTDSIIVTTILAIGMPLRVFNNIHGIVCEATATLNLKVVFQIVYIALLSILYYLFKDYALMGIALSFIIAEFAMLIAYTNVTRKLLNYSIANMLQTLAPGVCTGIITGACIFIITAALKTLAAPTLIILISQMLTGGLCLLALLFLGINKSIKIEIHKRLSHSIVNAKNQSISNRLLSKAVRALSVH